MAETTHFSSYNVSGSKTDKVKLSVEIGYAQNAATDIRIDNVRVAGDSDDGSFKKDLFTVELGTNAELTGRSLVINSAVHKVNSATDMTSITITITGGKAILAHSMSAAVNPQTNMVIYTYYISCYS